MSGNSHDASKPIRIGISSCLLGQEVRFDGGHKRDSFLTDTLGPQVEWVPVCPEVEIGLGIPREPVRLVRAADDAIRMVTTSTGVDHTETMARWAIARLEELAREDLCGYVLKKDSPSCGMEYVKTYSSGGTAERNGRGLFAAALMRRFPSLPVEEEGRLADPRIREDFIERVFAYARQKGRTPSACGPSEARSRRASASGGGAPRALRDDDRPRPERAQYRSVPVTVVGRPDRGIAGSTRDLAAVEEPLEVRLHGKPFAVIMRTPGEDRALAAGFLLSEGVVRTADDIGAVEHCRHPDRPDGHNVVDVYLLGESRTSLETLLADRRNVLTNSSCGLCGRVTIESLKTRASALPVSWTMTTSVAAGLPQRLRERQRVFDGTGGLHAAGLFTPDGICETSAEDVGRHNAVDKVIGAMVLDDRLPIASHALAVSGRASFEIVQKAWLAGIGLVCAVSAPSSLAIDLAEDAGITLLGFARGGGFNVYSHPARLPEL